MAEIIAYTRTDPQPVAVDADIYTGDDGDRWCIMIRTHEGIHGTPVPLTADQADLLGTNLRELAEQLRSDDHG